MVADQADGTAIRSDAGPRPRHRHQRRVRGDHVKPRVLDLCVAHAASQVFRGAVRWMLRVFGETQGQHRGADLRRRCCPASAGPAQTCTHPCTSGSGGSTPGWRWRGGQDRAGGPPLRQQLHDSRLKRGRGRNLIAWRSGIETQLSAPPLMARPWDERAAQPRQGQRRQRQEPGEQRPRANCRTTEGRAGGGAHGEVPLIIHDGRLDVTPAQLQHHPEGAGVCAGEAGQRHCLGGGPPLELAPQGGGWADHLRLRRAPGRGPRAAGRGPGGLRGAGIRWGRAASHGTLRGEGALEGTRRSFGCAVS